MSFIHSLATVRIVEGPGALKGHAWRELSSEPVHFPGDLRDVLILAVDDGDAILPFTGEHDTEWEIPNKMSGKRAVCQMGALLARWARCWPPVRGEITTDDAASCPPK